MTTSPRILTIVSNFGYWGVELAGPMARLEAAGYELVLATPHGRRPVALPPSYETDFLDPPLGAHVTTAADARQVLELEAGSKLDDPIDISAWFPQRPYFSRQGFLRAWEAYHARVAELQRELAHEYAAVFLVGGSGPILDVVNNQRVHDIVLGFYRARLPIAAICYGVATLVMARDFNERASILRGRHVTGHCVEYDYLDGTGFVGTDLNIGPAPYTLEYLLRDAVGPEGAFHGNFGRPTSVVVDHPFITARSLQCSHEFGDQFVNVLEHGLRRYGW